MDTYSRMKQIERMKDILSNGKNDHSGLFGMDKIFKNPHRCKMDEYKVNLNVKVYSNCNHIGDFKLDGNDVNIKSIIIETKNIIDDDKMEPKTIEYIDSTWEGDVFSTNIRVNVDFISGDLEESDEKR